MHVGELCYFDGKYDEAKQYHDDALAIRRTTLNQFHGEVANSLGL